MDNLINDKIDMLIMNSMKNHDTARTETLRSIKAAFLNWKTMKENAGKTMTSADETQVLKKMVKQRQESIEQYCAAARNELADAEQAQIDVIQEFLPAEATEKDILKCFNDVIGQDGFEPIKKNMGIIIKYIKSALPNADGKMVATIVQSNLA